MRRISVIGSSAGAGKTTIGRRLAEKLGLPFIELDALRFGPRWSLVPDELFRERVATAVAGEAWVADGNYGMLNDMVWASADTLVWLDIPFRVAFWRILKRTLRRIISGEELWEHGNRESIRNAFFDRQSLLLYTARTYRRRRRRWERYLAEGRFDHLEVHRFRSTAEAERWLASL